MSIQSNKQQEIKKIDFFINYDLSKKEINKRQMKIEEIIELLFNKEKELNRINSVLSLKKLSVNEELDKLSQEEREIEMEINRINNQNLESITYINYIDNYENEMNDELHALDNQLNSFNKTLNEQKLRISLLNHEKKEEYDRLLLKTKYDIYSSKDFIEKYNKTSQFSNSYMRLSNINSKLLIYNNLEKETEINKKLNNNSQVSTAKKNLNHNHTPKKLINKKEELNSTKKKKSYTPVSYKAYKEGKTLCISQEIKNTELKSLLGTPLSQSNAEINKEKRRVRSTSTNSNERINYNKSYYLLKSKNIKNMMMNDKELSLKEIGGEGCCVRLRDNYDVEIRNSNKNDEERENKRRIILNNK